MIQSRRNYFSAFLGEASVFVDEIKGNRNIPLNKLNTLAKSSIRALVPVYFDEGKWKIENSHLMKSSEGEFHLYRKLTETETFLASLFGRGDNLFMISKRLSDFLSIELEEAERLTQKLFFKFAKLRICHPAHVSEADID